jgi:glycosyltransferase involved in cell wall biosynthesis
MRILTLNNLNDFRKEGKLHFSLMKGFNITKAFADLGNETFFASTGEEEDLNGVTLLPHEKITKEFLDSVDMIFMIRETTFLRWMDKLPYLKEIFEKGSKNRKQIIGIKTDNPAWCFRKGIKVDGKPFDKKFIYNNFNFICAQNVMMFDRTVKYFEGDKDNKFPKTDMAVVPLTSTELEAVKNFNNPYDDFKYCVDDFSQLEPNKALFPLPFISKYRIKKLPNPKTQKRLIYTGRLRIDKGRILNVLKDIMKGLGNEYELHLFPGSTDLPGISWEGDEMRPSLKSLHPKDPSSRQIIRDVMFPEMENVYLHNSYKFDDLERWKFFYNADCGLDFSQTRPHRRRSEKCNCKLLDYLNIGLPCVVDGSIGNSNYISEGNAGIVIDEIGSTEEFVEAIKKVCSTNYDREKIRNYMKDNHTWQHRAFNLLDYLMT